MKKHLVLVIYILTMFTLLFFIQPQIAEAESRITIYNQADKKYNVNNYFRLKHVYKEKGKTKVKDPTDLHSIGCRVFSYVHAVEWITGKKDDNSEKTLWKFEELCKTYKDPPNTNHSEYINYIKAKWKEYSIEGSSGSKPESKLSLMEKIKNGWVLIINTYGHFTCVVDYVICDNNLNIIDDDGTSVADGCGLYVQIIDSWARASFQNYDGTERRAFYGKPWYTKNGTKLVKQSSKNPGEKGTEYYVKFDAYSLADSSKSAMIRGNANGSWRPNHTTVKTDPIRMHAITKKEIKVYSSNKTSSTVVTTIPPQHGVIIVGTYPQNTSNHTWYKIAEGQYIEASKSNFLEEPKKSDEKGIGNVKHKDISIPVHSRYSDLWLTAQPYADKDRMVQVGKNDPLTVVEVILNGAAPERHYWVKVKYKDKEYYACANNIEAYDSISVVKDDNIVNIPPLPSGNHIRGESRHIEGTVTSLYPMVYAKAEIIPDVIGGYSYSTREVTNGIAGKKSFDLKKSEVNLSQYGGVPFGEIPVGSYTLKLTIQYEISGWHNVKIDTEDPVISKKDAAEKISKITVKEKGIVYVNAITLNTINISMDVGQVKYINATVTPENAKNKKTVWKSSNPNIVTVADGKVTAVGTGTTTIVVSSEDGSNKQATCSVTVTKKANEVLVSPSSMIMYIGDEPRQLLATVNPSDASNKTITWNTSDSNIASVDNSGNISAKSVGTANIIAKANDGSGIQGICKVDVRSYVDGISISGSDVVNVGSSIKLLSTALPSNAYNKAIVWTSSDETIATVDADGNVVGNKPGNVTITAIAMDRGIKKSSRTIYVKQPVTDIVLSGMGTVLKGNTTGLIAEVFPSNASDKTLFWSSEDITIAEVNNGIVTAKSSGSTTIWATAAGSGKKAGFSITVQEPVSRIEISGEEIVPIDGSIQLSATVFPQNAENKSVLWTTDQGEIAIINGHGVLKGVQPGVVTVTATATDGSGIFAEYSVRIVKQLIAIQINGDNAIHTGQEKQLTATVSSDQPLDDAGVIWSSSNESVVKVTADGKIYGVSNGTAVITATSRAENYYSSSQLITVTTLISSISVSGENELDESNNTQLAVEVFPASASNKNVIWSSSSPAVANVDGNGKVYALSAGTTLIRALATDGSGISGTIEITVYPLPHSIMIEGTGELLVEQTAQLNATVLPIYSRNKNVIWTSEDESIATVDAAGRVTAVGNGTVDIIVTAEGNTSVSERHSIEVTTLVSAIELTAPDRINVGGMESIAAEIFPTTASCMDLNWTSSDDNLAVVDAKGNVTAMAPGLVTITATAIDGSNVSTEIGIEIFQLVQNISIDVEPIGHVGETLYFNAIVYPENASIQSVEYTLDSEVNAEMGSFLGTTGSCNFLTCKKTGLVQITATATDGSNVSGYAYVLVLPYTELRNTSEEYVVYSGGQANGTLGTVSLSSDCAYRAAEDKYGAVWSIEHISGDYATAVGMNENAASYDGFSLANSVSLNLLRINRTGTDVYRVSCSINNQVASCDVTVHAVQPSEPLPTSVNLTTGTYYAQVGETINIDTGSRVIQPTGAALPAETDVYLYGNGAFNRYAQVTMADDICNVSFTKAGTYSAFVRYSGTNYQYDANVNFVITTAAGTVPPEIEELSIDNPVKYMLIGETLNYDVIIIPSAADEADLLWSSSDPDVVSVSDDGLLTALQTGTAIITASADNGVSTTGFVAVTETLLSIDWNDEDVIEVYVEGNSKTVIQKVFLTPRASAQLTEAPSWTLKRIDGNNLTLSCEPITGKDASGQDVYGCAIVLKSVSSIGQTEYELTCSDGLYSTSTVIKVNANEIEGNLPSMISWNNSVYTAKANELISIRPVIQCWPNETTLPDSVLVSVNGDQYWNDALNLKDYAVSRNAMTFSFSEPGIYTANCVYSCSNMRYLVPITIRIADENGTVPVRATNITLNENEISVRAGETAQLKAVIAPEDATNKTVTWQSRDTSVATVNEDGLVTGVRNGKTGILCVPSDPNLSAIECMVAVEDTFTVNQYTEMNRQYLQGETGYAVAGFALSNGTQKRIQAEGLEAVWSFTRVSGHAATVELKEYKGVQYLNVTSLLAGGKDVYRVTCTAGDYTWSGEATLAVEDLGASAPTSVTLSQKEYTANIGEEITLNFTPVCKPVRTKLPSVLTSDYIGIGNFYDALIDDYHMALFEAGDQVKVAFRKPGRYILSRQYTGLNLTYVTECIINIMGGNLNLLKCTDNEPTVYIGGKSSIATTCVISDTSIEDLYGDELVWKAERLSGDCMTVALRADQSSASLYVVNARETGEETWRISCSFRGITDYVDVTIQAVMPRTDLPDSVSLYQTEFSGMIGNQITVPLAVQCEPEGTSLPSGDDEAWSFTADRNTTQNANWSIKDNQMSIRFRESGYYGGQLIYRSGNVSYSFRLGFAITDEEYGLTSPDNLTVSLSKDTIVVYPEGESGMAIIDAALTEHGSANNLSSIAAYAKDKNAAWSLQIVSGNACDLSIGEVSASGVHIILNEITGTGDVNYRITCSIEGQQYTAEGIVHVASGEEPRPQPEVKKSYFTTLVGTVLTIDASFYDKTSHAKLCSGSDSIWDNADALAAMGYEYETSGDFLLPVFYETGVYTTIISNRTGNLPVSQEIKIVVYSPRKLPANPSVMTFPMGLTEIDEETFAGIGINVIDLRGTKVKNIQSKAFANNTNLVKIYIPASVQFISDDAFVGCTDIEICCIEGSYADVWAKRNGFVVNYDMD